MIASECQGVSRDLISRKQIAGYFARRRTRFVKLIVVLVEGRKEAGRLKISGLGC